MSLTKEFPVMPEKFGGAEKTHFHLAAEGPGMT
jgi:hypothetical protein